MSNIHLLQMMENTEGMMRKQEGINESAVIQRFLMRAFFGIAFFVFFFFFFCFYISREQY